MCSLKPTFLKMGNYPQESPWTFRSKKEKNVRNDRDRLAFCRCWQDKKMSTDPEICDATTDTLYYRIVDVY